MIIHAVVLKNNEINIEFFLPILLTMQPAAMAPIALAYRFIEPVSKKV